MKKIILGLLVVLLVLGLCSCSKADSKYSQLKSWLEDNGEITNTDGTSIMTKATVTDDQIVISEVLMLSNNEGYRLIANLTDGKCEFTFNVIYGSVILVSATGMVLPKDVMLNGTVTFDSYQSYYNNSTVSSADMRATTASMLYDSIKVVDSMIDASGVSMKELGYTSLTKDTGKTEEPFDDYRNKPFLDRLGFAGLVTLIGLGMVFAVIALLWGILEISRLVFTRKAKKKVAPAVSPAVVRETVKELEPVVDDNGETVAAITAAVAAYLASEAGGAYTGGFRVVSFKRAGNGSAWNKK